MKQLMLALVLALASSLGLAADSWPAKPVHVIVPFPPGSSPDLVARMLTEKLAQVLGQAVIVDNKPGAGGNIGTGQVAKAEPDGYTIGLSIPGPLAVNTVLYKNKNKMGYDPFTELAPITLVALSPNVLIVNPGLGVNSVQEFIAYVKARPGKLNYGSVGNGSASHLTMELLKMQAGLDIVHVPYPGSPQVITAILGDQIQAGFIVPGTAMPLAKSGRVKALAVTSSSKSAVLPDMPTVADAGFPGFESSAWLGMVAPANTPKPVIDRLSRELVAIIRSPEIGEKMGKIYFQPVGTTPEGLADLMRSERDRWAKVIKQTGAGVD
ncbi:MAG: tripartite tricarboxylate transporter substrate binding protein [Burkholderiales bacterium]|nr:tripartite tricarboxylate transporter substrate binding protein [Burkholderiales bacterium]